MQYGYFDDLNREYVITRPDTPSPWVNYLGDTEYGAIISNNAGDTALKNQVPMVEFCVITSMPLMNQDVIST